MREEHPRLVCAAVACMVVLALALVLMAAAVVFSREEVVALTENFNPASGEKAVEVDQSTVTT